MHIPENYLSPETCAVMTAAMVPVWAHAAKKVKEELPREKVTMLGTGAAFSFLVMMINVPLIGGTTGHAVGGVLVALLFGPGAACIGVSVALLLQALIFGDGGVLAFGANCFNMAFVLPYVGYFVYRTVAGFRGNLADVNPIRKYAGAAAGAYIGLNAAALCAAVEFGIQPMLFHDGAGNGLYCPYDLTVSIPAMMIPHLAVAGVVEALFTVAVFAFVTRTAPDMLINGSGMQTAPDAKSRVPLFAVAAAMIAASPLGLLASGTAWGEWGADEIAQTSAGGETLGYIPEGLASGWSLDVLLPDYAMDGVNEVLVYVFSAALGTSILVMLFKLISIPFKGRRN